MPTVRPYEEPSLVNLLVFSSLLYLLNVARVLADYLFHGGIVAEIALGVIYGSPLAQLLPSDWEVTLTVLGYIGLILVVFEGGLSSNLPTLLSNLPLSIVCALTGIGLPIAFSFALLNAAFGYGTVEAFAAGAALSSTSLGTTLAALNSVSNSRIVSAGKVSDTSQTSQSMESSFPASRRTPSLANCMDTYDTVPSDTSSSLQQSRIGTVLISAAIIDDVVGLVIAAVIPALASIQSDSGHTLASGSLAWTIVRPLLSSVLIAALCPMVSRFILRPLFWHSSIGERWCASARLDKPWGAFGFARVGSGWGTEAHADAVKLFLMIAMLSGMAAISHYTGTSVLYGAYVAGLMLTYISQPPISRDQDKCSGRSDHVRRAEELSFEAAFSRVLGPIQNHVLLPLFFASIGYAIPFLDLWRPTIIWRGIVYSILMCLAKLAVGLPILLYDPLVRHASPFASAIKRSLTLTCLWIRATACPTIRRAPGTILNPNTPPEPSSPTQKAGAAATNLESAPPSPSPNPHSSPSPSTSLPPSSSTPAAVFMGLAMVARGEIGLLIAQLAHGASTGADGEGTAGLLGEEPFLLCIWAILLCTLVGPVSLGYVVRRWGARVNTGIWA
ncbi:hypothetical protein BD413DRAFT_603990 [Trametes elegans]|nr:hypothetical protein BD413DRAFT_603990 [Trametes elegans]